jgi:hypothetical protein
VPNIPPLPAPPAAQLATPTGAAGPLAQQPGQGFWPAWETKDTRPTQPRALTPPPDPAWTMLPPRDKIFVMYNDAQLQEIIMNGIREEDRRAKRPSNEVTLHFPAQEPVGGGLPYVSKTVNYPPAQGHYAPLYLVHRRLHFEEKNAERYGWDLGFIQPLVSAMYFYKDVLLWPNSLASGCAYGFWDTNAGKCLPGSPTPYMLYPPGLTITGGAFEGAIITGAAFVFP